MQLPLSFIRSFLDITISPQEIAKILTSLGIEVDQIVNETPPFSGVVTAEVLSASPHPNADSLQVTEVFDGENKWQVICGASNCRAGMKTAFARIGAVLSFPNEKPLHIGKRAIRGIESNGMLCSFSELSIQGPAHDTGIIELPPETQLGIDATSFLWNPIFVISLTPNLGHCLSGLGIARELSAALNIPLKYQNPICHSTETEKMQIEIHHAELCSDYAYQIIDQIEVKPSPLWLQLELYAAGMKPISNIVDITNYILLQFGQPLHTFDFHQIEGSTLYVGLSQEGQHFHGLDDIERKLPSGVLLISDEKKPLALAGILGGLTSAVSSKTTKILLESAHFDPMTVRKGSKKVGARTESSQRFEKGVDPAGICRALNAAAALIKASCFNAIISAQIHHQTRTCSQRKIILRTGQVKRILGVELSLSEMESIFQRLEMNVEPLEDAAFVVTPPSYRFDLEQEIDLIEEIGRIYGYQNIPRKPPLFRSTLVPHDPRYLFQKKVRDILNRQGLQECISSNLISPKAAQLFQENMGDKSLLHTVHAKTEEYSVLRPSLLPSLLQTAANNFRHRTLTIHAFEIGNIHFMKNQEVLETSTVGILLAGQMQPPHFSEKTRSVDFFDLKGIIQNLFTSLSLGGISYRLGHHPSFQPNHQGEILLDNKTIGAFGKIHPSLAAKLNITESLFYAEIDLASILSSQDLKPRMTPLPQFPASERDWTVTVHSHFCFEKLQKAIESARPPLLAKWELIDLYIPEDKAERNITLRFIYRDDQKTISHLEVEQAHMMLISKISLDG